MKKTEKIEIRLSHDDKERLNQIAEREGRTISQIVRGLIERYMDLNSSASPRKTSKKEKLLWGLSGAALSALVLVPSLNYLNQSDKEAQTYLFSTLLIPNTGGGLESGSIGVPLIEGFNENFEMHSEEQKFRYSLKLEKSEFGQFRLLTDICRIVEDDCQDNTLATLSFDEKSSAQVIVADKIGNEHRVQIEPSKE